MKRNRSKILNFAHRGFTRQYPDNTLESFQAAIDLGTDGMECDVHETCDQNFVVYHDGEINGTNIHDLSLIEVLEQQIENKYKIPVLPEVLRLCKGRAILFIELKQISSPDILVKLVKDIMKPDEVLFGSFNTEILQWLHRFAPEYQKGVIAAYLSVKPLELLEKNRCSTLVIRFAETNTDLVENIHRNGKSVLVWDCNTTGDIRNALSMEVDGIVSDYPDTVKQEMKDYYKNR